MALQDLYRTSLRRCYTRLVDDLDPQPVLDRFHEREFLPHTVIRDMEETAKTSDKNRAIIEKVMNKGPEGYKQFKQILKVTHQEHLAEHLTNMEKRLQEEKHEEAQQKPRQGARDGPQTGAPSRPQQRAGASVRPQQQASRPRAPVLPAQRTGAVSQTGHAATTNLVPLQTAQPAHGTPSTDTWQQHLEFLSDKYLFSLAEGLGSEWYSVAINLGIRRSTIDQIMMMYPHNVAMQIVTAFASWRDSSSHSNMVEDMIAALERAGRRDLGIKVKQDFERPREQSRRQAENVRVFQEMPISEHSHKMHLQPNSANRDATVDRKVDIPLINTPQFNTPSPESTEHSFPVRKEYGQSQQGIAGGKAGTSEPLATNNALNEHTIAAATSTNEQPATFMHSYDSPMGNTQAQDASHIPVVDMSRLNLDGYDGQGTTISNRLTENPNISTVDTRDTTAMDITQPNINAPRVQNSTSSMNIGEGDRSNIHDSQEANSASTPFGDQNVKKKNIAPRHPGVLTIGQEPPDGARHNQEGDFIDAARHVETPLDILPTVYQKKVISPEQVQGEIIKRMQTDLDVLKSTVTPTIQIPTSLPQADLNHEKQISPLAVANPDSQTTDLKTFQWRKVDKCPHDGRIWELKVEDVKKAIADKPLLNKGGFGDVFKCETYSDDLMMPVVIKRIQYEEDIQRKRSAINEILAARVMHFAIVPLLGMVDDKADKTFYFMFPYLENNDLFDTIQSDFDNIENKRPAQLGAQDRLKILYQIASALKFLHTEVPDFRGSVIHRDITTKNIVLDCQNNARLLDFGLCRVFKENQTSLRLNSSANYGTPGYSVTKYKKELTKGFDCSSFGIVILELLTGRKPVDGKDDSFKLKKEVDEILEEYSDFEEHIDKVWNGKHETTETLVDLAKKCLKGEGKHITEEIYNTLEGLLQTLSIPTWTPLETKDKKEKCVICMVNPKAAVDVFRPQSNHGSSCNLKVCVACMRNSYLNPIQCHTCGNHITTSIGNGRGAILIAGNDMDEQEKAKQFYKELSEMHKTIVSKYPLTMGISEKNIHCVYPASCGKPDTLMAELDKSFDQLKGNNLDTLVLYFNGHFRNMSTDKVTREGFILGNDDEFLTKEKLEQYMSDLSKVGFKKFIIFLDCCMAPGITLPELSGDISIVQLSASRPNIPAMMNKCGSPFTQCLIKGLKGKAIETCPMTNSPECRTCKDYCSLDGLISIDMLHKNIHSHMENWVENVTVVHIKGADLNSTKIAYFIDNRVEMRFHLEHENDKITKMILTEELPDSMIELTRMLLPKFSEQFKLPDVGMSDYSEYSDILSVMVKTGPKQDDVLELQTIPQVIAAWNGKQRLYVGLRCIENLKQGIVGIFLGEEENATVILEEYLKSQPACQVKTNESGRREEVKIKLSDTKPLFISLSKIQRNDQPRCVHLRFLIQKIIKVVKAQEFENRKYLLISFPWKQPNRTIHTQFLTLQAIPENTAQNAASPPVN